MNSFTRVLMSVVLLSLAANANGSAQFQEGDTLSFWSVSYVDWDPGYPTEQHRITAVCNRVGDNCYVFIDTSVGLAPDQPQIDAMVDHFDTNYSQDLPPLYGPIPNEFDNDPRVFVLIIPVEDWIGYFDPAQQMADSLVYRLWEKRSSEREILYLTTDTFDYGSELYVIAHEFGHMLHWGRDHSPEPPEDPVIYWEDAWIDEAFSNFAPVYLIEDVNIPDVYDPDAFFATDPDLSLIHFLGGDSYNKMKLWSTFMYEHYGSDFISTLIQDQENGIPGVRNTLSGLGYVETFEDTFEQWVLANYLDDEEYQSGRYSYNHYDFPSCSLTSTHISYPTGLMTESVSSFAADYIAFNSDSPVSITIDFAGDSTSVFRLSAIMYDSRDSVVKGIESILLDPRNRGTFNTDSLGSTCDQIVLVVMNTDSSLGEEDFAEYTYIADTEATGISGTDRRDPSEGGAVISFSLGQNYPNPFNPSTTISFDIPSPVGAPQRVMLTIYDIRGRRVKSLIDSELVSGRHTIIWDGRNERGESVPSGIYFYTLRARDMAYTRKMTLRK